MDNNVCIESLEFKELREFLSKKTPSRPLFLLTDENVREYCLPMLEPVLDEFDPVRAYAIGSGETVKNMNTVMDVCKFLAEHQAGREAILVNLGGGVVSDIGGLVASVYKRGIEFINLPTSLLAQIDASVGGKTGVDAFGYKNLIGTFAKPAGVFIYPGFLDTLDPRHLTSGFAEALKHALIADKGYWEMLRDFSFEQYDAMIIRSVEIKSSIANLDPKEEHDRKKLNFGHTIGHAIESYFINRGSDAVLHGEAVAAGMICESWLSMKYTGLSQEAFDDIFAVVRKYFSRIKLPKNNFHELLGYMKQDKKNISGQISFTLLEDIGTAQVNKLISDAEIIASLEFYESNA